jgi:hypothetical protein
LRAVTISDPSLLLALGAAALLLSIERIAYAIVWHRPDVLRRLARFGEPVDALRRLFYGFKAIQAGVFLGWLAWFGGGLAGIAPTSDRVALAAGIALAAAGQILNASVFVRLGRVGVFYGARFGHSVPWVEGFPFSLLAHPQYAGTVLTIWGFCLATRFPHADWVALPLLETVYYVAGALLEREPTKLVEWARWRLPRFSSSASRCSPR